MFVRIISVGVLYRGIIVELVDRGVEAEEKAPVDSVVLCLWREGEGCPTGVHGVVGPPSKSQDTPCLEQLPHTGCTSSHFILRCLHL